MNYKEKYIKYKTKYLELKKMEQSGGGAEMYCEICGAPLTNHNIFKINNINKYKKYIDKLYKKYSDSTDSKKWVNKFSANGFLKQLLDDFGDEIPKNILDIDSYDNFIGELADDIEINPEKYNWLSDILFIRESGEIIEIDAESSDTWTWEFKDELGNELNYDDGDIVHYDCYQLTKSTERDSYNFLHKYQDQDVPWLDFFYDKIDFVLESPLENKKNKNRIINKKGNMWNVVKDKNGIGKLSKKKEKISANKKKNRPSPSESATQFKVGTKKKGNDGNMWIIVENKNGVKRWSKSK
jgi:hypothetical protein